MIDDSLPISIFSDGEHTVECYRLSKFHVVWAYRCAMFKDIAGIAETPDEALAAARQYNEVVANFYL